MSVSIRSQLLLLMLAVLLPGLLAVLLFVGSAYEAQREANTRTLRDTSRALSQVVESVSVSTRHVLAIVALILLTADTLATIHQLALVHRMMTKLSETADELRLQLALGKADLADYLDDARESLGDRLGDVRGILGDVRETINGKLDDAKEALTERLTTPSDTSEKLRLRYEELLDKIERATRHLRYTYRNMSSQQHSFSLSAVTEASRRYKAQRDAARTAKRDEKKRARKGKPT